MKKTLFLSKFLLVVSVLLFGITSVLAQGRGSSSLNDAYLGEQKLESAHWPSLVSVKAVDGSHDLEFKNGKLSRLYYGKAYQVTCIDDKYELVKITTSWDGGRSINAENNSATFVASNKGIWSERLIDVYFRPKNGGNVAKRFTVKVASSQGIPLDKPLFEGQSIQVSSEGYSATIEEGKEITVTVYTLNHEAQTLGYNHVLTYIKAGSESFDLAPFTKSKELKMTVSSDIEIQVEQQKTAWSQINKFGEGTLTVTGTKDNKAEGRVLIVPNKVLKFEPKPAEGYVLKSLTMEVGNNGIIRDLTKTLSVEAEADALITVIFEKKKQTTAIEGLETPAISLYPNPTASQLFMSGLQANSDVKLFSLSGVLLRQTKSNAQGSAQFLGLESLPKALYLVKSGSWTEKVLIK